MPLPLQAFYSDVFELPLPERHRFPMAKYRLLYQQVATQLRHQVRLIRAPAATDEQLRLVHTAAYVQRVCQGQLSELEQRRIGLPWSPQLVDRSRRSVGATLAAARQALVDQVAVNLAGGTHHAFADHGQGFCVFNDVAVAVRVLQTERLIQRAVILDCDVHQGNGTAAIFANDDTVFTCSLHGERNYPFSKCAGDLDLALPDGTGDEGYLSVLADVLQHHLPLAQAGCVFYLAGADPYLHDRLGRLRLTQHGLQLRDQLVLATCRRLAIPVAVVMAGGYAPQIEQTVQIHTTTVQVAASMRSLV